MGNTVKVADIFRGVLMISNLDPNLDSNKRNLNNKLTFLMKQVVLRNKSEFKPGRDIKIPMCDASIVRNLLVESISGKGIVYDWFNGNVDVMQAENSILLYWQLKEPIMRALMTGETDEVTMDSWLATIQAAIRFNLADKTVQLKRKLEDFRVNSLALDSTVRVGDIYSTFEDGSRQYEMKGTERGNLLSAECLGSIVCDLYTQEDYFKALNQIIDKMSQDAVEKAKSNIETYALAKDLSEAERASKLISTADESMASEYFIWFQKLAEYLHSHPQVAKEIEESTKTTGLEKFFRIY
ncbi:hypothetical protein [Clostridium tagluense]|uniref:hypothetical protein n=1 Tax=Clostridium tagluense TaxID=360422 RepID=UPI001CF2F8B3|nr:hypothetical protein [Clostridium tagluense]MCB2301097.1 hypothetical protein [Clostridium tagluense]